MAAALAALCQGCFESPWQGDKNWTAELDLNAGAPDYCTQWLYTESATGRVQAEKPRGAAKGDAAAARQARHAQLLRKDDGLSQ